MAKSAVIILSGGMDSSVLAHELRGQNYLLKALTFNHGQKHAIREAECARLQAEILGIEQRLIDLSVLSPIFGASALTSNQNQIPEGHYTDSTMKATVVPNRNMIMLSIAAAWAIALSYDYVAYAAHTGDHTIYPDCRPEFAEALSSAIALADWHQVRLLNPFISMSKSEICALGGRLKIDFAKTWSCYKGADSHCGLCGTCVERREAFQLAGIPDPTLYLSSGV